MICTGIGECLNQCDCECYEICICEHRTHYGYCPSTCCMPINCRNFIHCNKKLPKWVLNCHNGMCTNCAIQMGKHNTSDIIEDCPVCLENKKMIILKCNHKMCNDCWYHITNNIENLCPLCRNLNHWR
jgi:hypothetical protein